MCMLEGISVIIYVFVFDRIVRHTHLHVCIFQTLLLILMSVYIFFLTFIRIYTCLFISQSMPANQMPSMEPLSEAECALQNKNPDTTSLQFGH